MNFSRLIFFLGLSLVSFFAKGQNDFSIKSSADKNSILIGQPMKLTVELSMPSGAPGSAFRIDSIDHFEFLGEPMGDTSTSDGRTIIKTIYTITSFDSGHWVIPSWVLGPKVRSDSIPVDVLYADYNPDQDYHDIKDIIVVAKDKKTPWWWYAIGGAVLLIGVVVYLSKKKKTIVISKPKVVTDPYQEAIKDLEALQRSKPDAKTFHSKLTDIFRLYIFRRKGILSLQKTTDDLVIQIKSLDLPKDDFDKIAQSFRMSDFVKFAKYVPSANDDEEALISIKNAIIKIEKMSVAATEAKQP